MIINLKIETMYGGIYKMYESKKYDIDSTKTRKGEIKEYYSKGLRLYVKWYNISGR